MRVEVVARIQHHPSRAHLIPPLRAALKGLRPKVIEHSCEPPSPWAGYRKCLDSLPKCSHLLIVQDDTTPAENFAPAVKAIARAHPDAPVCLFLARLPRDASMKADRAQKQNQRYIQLSWRSFLPVVATLWPIDKALEFRDWADKNEFLPGLHSPPRSDDAMAGRWKMVTRQTVLACVPSIVQHPDEEPSTIGRQAQWGRDKGRIAALFAPDASLYDWSQP